MIMLTSIDNVQLKLVFASIYAYPQSIDVANDHIVDCMARPDELEAALLQVFARAIGKPRGDGVLS